MINWAIEAWDSYRSDRPTATSADGFTIPMGGEEDFLDCEDDDWYGYMVTECAIGSLCKLRSQRETIQQLLTFVCKRGDDDSALKCFNGSYHGANHVKVLRDTLNAVIDAIEVKAAEMPRHRPSKPFETV